MEPPVRACTLEHCRFPIDPNFAPYQFEIDENDSEAMKKAKRYWNSSYHPCHKNFMNGKEQYRILCDCEQEITQLRAEWGKISKEKCSFFREYGDSIKRLEEMGKEMIKYYSTSHRKSFVAKFVENHPKTAMAINAVCIASVAVFFLHPAIRR